MHDEEAATTVIVVCAASGFEQGAEARPVRVRWVHSIKAAMALLNSAPGGAVVITELALRDGNWRDLVEELRRLGKPVPVALVSHARTSELWWDALECGIEDVLPSPLTLNSIRQYLDSSSE